MAYHFRRVRNTLRLFPSAKTIGFSTRANEGDGHNVAPPVNTCTNSCHATSPAKCGKLTSLDASEGEPTFDAPQTQSDHDLIHSFFPAVLSQTHTLPVTYSDLVQILRLPPLVAKSSKEFSQDVISVLKVVQPTSDDILAEPWEFSFHGAGGSSEGNYLRSFTTDSIDRQREKIPLDVLDTNCFLRKTHAPSSSLLHLFSDSDFLANHTLSSTLPPQPLCRSEPDPQGIPNPSTSGPQGNGPSKNGPTPEQLQKVKEKLEKMVCKMFYGRQDLSALHKNVVLENNLFGDNKSCTGLLAYGMEILKLRLWVHTRFSNTSVELHSVTVQEQAGVIRIHWRLKGVSQIHTLKFWRLLQSRTPISKDDYEWLDAFSYFHVGKDGLVHKHRIDRMIPDDASGKDKIADTLRELLTPAKPLVS